MAEAILNVSVTARGSAELSKIETSIRHIRQASVGAISDQIRALKELYAVTPATEQTASMRGAMRDVLQNITELGGKSKMTASDIASANDTIAASIKRVNEAIAERTPAGTEYKPESGRWHGPTGFVKTPSGAAEMVPHLMRVRDALQSVKNKFFELQQEAGFFVMKGEKLSDIMERLSKFRVMKEARKEWSAISEDFGKVADRTKEAAQGVAEMGAKVSVLGSEFQVIRPLADGVANIIGKVHREVKTFELVARAGEYAARELSTGFIKSKESVIGLIAPFKKIITSLGAANPKVLAVMAGFAALRVTFLAVRKAINIIVEGTKKLIDFLKRLAGAVRDIVRFMRNLIRSLVDAGRAVYNFGRRVLETAKNMTQKFLGGVRSLVGGLRNLVPGLRDSSSAGDGYNRTFYLTTKRSYEAARAVDFLASVAGGFTTGLAVARGNLTSLAFAANQLRRSIIPVFAAVAAGTVVFAGAARAAKTLVEQTLDLGAKAQDATNMFATLTGTMAEGEQMWQASIQWAMKYGRDLDLVREYAVDFYKAGLDVNQMLDASQALAAAWSMELGQAVEVLNTAVGEEEGAIETLKEYGIVLEDITNETDRNARATAIAAAVMDKYGSAASEFTKTLTGAMGRAKTVIQSFWEVLTKPLAINVLPPVINAFSDFASTIVTLTHCLWESDRAQAYFNKTLSIARGLVERFRPEITILGNIVRLIVTAAFWALQGALRGVVNLMGRMLTWVKHLIGAFSALIRPIKPLANAFNALAGSWKNLAFTDLLQRVKEFVLDFPITILGIETSLREILETIWRNLTQRIPEHVKAFVASLGSQLLAHMLGIKKLSIGGIVGALVTVLLNWLGRSIQDFLTEAFPHLESMLANMFDTARWFSIIGGVLFGAKGALVGYLLGLFVGYLDETFSLGIHEWISTGLAKIGEYFREKWNLFWQNLFTRVNVGTDPSMQEAAETIITGINFDRAFNALADSFKKDWNEIFLPKIQGWLGMKEGGAYKISDYIGHALMRAVEGAVWVGKMMIKLYELLKKAWNEHLVPFWEAYIQPEIDNLWENYIQPPLGRLQEKWKSFWSTMFRGFSGTAEVGVETDVDWGKVQDPSQVPDMGFDAQGFIDTSSILSTVQGLIDDIAEIFQRAPIEEAENLGEAVYSIGRGLYFMGRGAYFAVKAAREIYGIMLKFSPLMQDTNEETEKSPGLLRKMGNWFGLCAKFIEKGSNAIEGFYDWLVKARAWIDEKGEELREGIKRAFAIDDLLKMIEEFKEDFKELFDVTLPGIIDPIKTTIFTPIKNAFIELYNELFGNTWSEDMVAGWEGMWADFATEGGKVDNNVFETLRQTFSTWKDTFFETWKTDAQKKWDDLFGSSGSLRGTANNTDSNIFVQIRSVFNRFVETYLENFKNRVSSKWNDVFGDGGLLQNSANSVKQRIIDPIASRFTYFKDHQWPGMINPLKDRWQYMFGGDGQEGFFRRAVNEFLGAFRTWASNFTGGPIQTIINGLSNLKWWLETVVGWFQSLISWRNTWNQGETKDPKPPSCFIRGTPVLMINGQTKNIESVEIGDIVLSFNPETENFVAGTVTSLQSQDTDRLYQISTDNKIIKVTGEHPFYMPNSDGVKVHKDFVRAKHISEGDSIFVKNGNKLSPMIVLDIKYIEESHTVYNFNVEEYHTYFADGVAVHNAKKTAHGGVFRGAQTRIIAESGPEAVIPLTHGAVPVQMLNAGSPGITVVIKDNTFGSPEDAKEVADIVSREILRRLRVRGVSTTGRF